MGRQTFWYRRQPCHFTPYQSTCSKPRVCVMFGRHRDGVFPYFFCYARRGPLFQVEVPFVSLMNRCTCLPSGGRLRVFLEGMLSRYSAPGNIAFSGGWVGWVRWERNAPGKNWHVQECVHFFIRTESFPGQHFWFENFMCQGIWER